MVGLSHVLIDRSIEKFIERLQNVILGAWLWMTLVGFKNGSHTIFKCGKKRMSKIEFTVLFF